MRNEVKSRRISGDKKQIIRLGLVILVLSIISIGIGAKGCNPWDDTTSGSSGYPDQVTSPNPANEVTDVPLNQQLGWASANGSTSYDVYFDTFSPPTTFRANVSVTSYNPSITYSETYYWQIDSKNTGGTTTGNIWSFQTEAEPIVPPDQVISPTPTAGAIGVPINQQLGWASAIGATSYDVYFDTFSPPTTLRTNVSGTSYNPGSLDYSETYYWQIDSKNTSGTTTGNIWSFQTPPPWTAVAAGEHHTLALKSDGTLWGWGWNFYGELGLGDTNQRSSPVQIGTDTDWAEVTAGYSYTIARKTDGTLYAWGLNNGGQLGLGDDINRTAPTKIITDTDWAEVTVGQHHTLARKSNGTLWAWGSNGLGQLGLGDTISRTVPTKVVTDTDWAEVTAGITYTIARKSNGTLWAWGRNNEGELGLGSADSNPHPNPVQIGSDTDWAGVNAGAYHVIACKTNNTLWAWGYNAFGELGLGDTNQRNAPVQIGTDTDWVEGVGWEYYTIARKTDGTLYAWGRNEYGQLGLGSIDSNPHPNPAQIGSDTDWVEIVAGSYHVIARKTNNTIWSWANNNEGQLGLGTLGSGTQRDSPTLIGQ